MKISGFTMVRNGGKYYFPIKESILSILPIVDEFIVALGKGDPNDNTLEQIESIQSPKIKIIPRIWNEEDFKDGKILRKETNFALSQCTGDWCFYLQADEVIHEENLAVIQEACQTHLNDDRVDGLLFNYYHFWGDYAHYLPFHGWYRNEIRLIKNNRNIASYRDAQSFRHKDNSKLTVKAINAWVYHYGWVRPPELMQSKKKEHDSWHWGKEAMDTLYGKLANQFDYGPLGKIPLFKGTHPKVMDEFIRNISWKNTLNYGKKHKKIARKKNRHERIKYRLLSSFENRFLGGKELFGFKNWNLLK